MKYRQSSAPLHKQDSPVVLAQPGEKSTGFRIHLRLQNGLNAFFAKFGTMKGCYNFDPSLVDVRIEARNPAVLMTGKETLEEAIRFLGLDPEKGGEVAYHGFGVFDPTSSNSEAEYEALNRGWCAAFCKQLASMPPLN